MSTEHWESGMVIEGVYACTENGTVLKKKGDGDSNGTIRIFAGIQGKIATVAVFHVASTQMNLIMMQGRFTNADHHCIPSYCVNLGEGNYLDTTKCFIGASWTLSKDIGHERHPEEEYLSVEEGWEYCKNLRKKHHLDIELEELHLPPKEEAFI